MDGVKNASVVCETVLVFSQMALRKSLKLSGTLLCHKERVVEAELIEEAGRGVNNICDASSSYSLM